jgi:hypothetical protein
MIHCLNATLNDSRPAAGILSGLGQHFREDSLRNVMGTGACNKDASIL